MQTGILEETLAQIASDLDALGMQWALVGGLAFSVLADPRTTRDVDLAVAVENDRQGESLIRDLAARGYEIHVSVEQEAAERLATVRLLSGRNRGIIVDLLLASSGIEPEIVALARPLEIFPGFSAPVIQKGHLIAVKVLAGRGRDLEDARALIRLASAEDLQLARDSMSLIDRRGYDRHKNLQAELQRIMASLEDSYGGSR